MSDQLWRCVKCGYEYRPAINCIEVCCPHHLAPLYMDVVEGKAPPTVKQLAAKAAGERLAVARQLLQAEKLAQLKQGGFEDPVVPARLALGAKPKVHRIKRKVTR